MTTKKSGTEKRAVRICFAPGCRRQRPADSKLCAECKKAGRVIKVVQVA